MLILRFRRYDWCKSIVPSIFAHGGVCYEQRCNEKDQEKLVRDIEQIKKDYTPRSVHERAYDEVRGDIKKITENYLTKEDFFREQAKTERKLDMILDILMKKGGTDT